MFSFRKKVYGTNNNKLIFLLSGWQGKIWNYYFTAKILEWYGYKSIIYEYDDAILASSVEDTVKNTIRVKDDILEEVRLHKTKGYCSFSIFGTSYGTIIGFLAANEEPSIANIIVNLSAADLALVAWAWNKKKDETIRRIVAKRRFRLKDLKQYWHSISPENNIDNLGDRHILFYEAQKDDILPYSMQARLLAKLKRINRSILIKTDTRFNHVLSAAINVLIYPAYIRFLEK